MAWHLKTGEQVSGPFEDGVVRSGLKSGFIDPKTTLFRQTESKSWISFEWTPFNIDSQSPIARIPPVVAIETNKPASILDDQHGSQFSAAPPTFPTSDLPNTPRRTTGLTGGETLGCLLIPLLVGTMGILVMKVINDQFLEYGLIIGFGGSALYFFYKANFKQRIWMGIGALAFGSMVSGMINAPHRKIPENSNQGPSQPSKQRYSPPNTTVGLTRIDISTTADKIQELQKLRRTLQRDQELRNKLYSGLSQKEAFCYQEIGLIAENTKAYSILSNRMEIDQKIQATQLELLTLKWTFLVNDEHMFCLFCKNCALDIVATFGKPESSTDIQKLNEQFLTFDYAL